MGNAVIKHNFEDQDKERRGAEVDHAKQALSTEIASTDSVEEFRDVITPLLENGLLIRRGKEYEPKDPSYEPVSEAANQKQRELAGEKEMPKKGPAQNPLQQKFELLRKATRIVPSKKPKKHEISIANIMDPFVQKRLVSKKYDSKGNLYYFTKSKDRQIQRLVHAANKRKGEIERGIELGKTKKRFEEIKNDPKGFVQQNKKARFAYKIVVKDEKHHRLIKVTDLAVVEGEADIQKDRIYIPGAMEMGKEIPHYLIRAAEEVDKTQRKKRENRKKQKTKRKKKN